MEKAANNSVVALPGVILMILALAAACSPATRAGIMAHPSAARALQTPPIITTALPGPNPSHAPGVTSTSPQPTTNTGATLGLAGATFQVDDDAPLLRLAHTDGGRPSLARQEPPRPTPWPAVTPLPGSPMPEPAAAPSLSSDGRWLAFASPAALIPSDSNGTWDVYVQDRTTGGMERVSAAALGGDANGPSLEPAISGDGRWVAFVSEARDLVSGDGNGLADVFLNDRITGITTRVSVGPDGQEADGSSRNPAISADGRWVAFTSRAGNLALGARRMQNVYVYDRQAQAIVRTVASPDGQPPDADTYGPALSADGRWLAFTSRASNLVPGVHAAGLANVFVHDFATGQTELISADSGGRPGDGNSGAAAISADGQWVAFASQARNLDPHSDLMPPNGSGQVFLHDRHTSQSRWVGVLGSNWEGFEAAGRFLSLSADGRWLALAEVPGYDETHKVKNGVIRLYDRETRQAGILLGRLWGAGFQPCISADGRYVAFSLGFDRQAAPPVGRDGVWVCDSITGVIYPGSSADGR